MRYELTEDEVRDKARRILDLESTESAQAGVGQLTSFNKLASLESKTVRTAGIYQMKHIFPPSFSKPRVLMSRSAKKSVKNCSKTSGLFRKNTNM